MRTLGPIAAIALVALPAGAGILGDEIEGCRSRHPVDGCTIGYEEPSAIVVDPGVEFSAELFSDCASMRESADFRDDTVTFIHQHLDPCSVIFVDTDPATNRVFTDLDLIGRGEVITAVIPHPGNTLPTHETCNTGPPVHLSQGCFDFTDDSIILSFGFTDNFWYGFPWLTYEGFESRSITFTIETGPSTCGDGNLDPSEQCDDGNRTGGDGCRSNCSLEVCADGLIDPQDECDDGNTVDGDGCSAECTVEALNCGNGLVEQGEECDDANTTPGDGCDELCQDEEGPLCALVPRSDCLTAAKAKLVVVNESRGAARLEARLSGFAGATAPTDFGDPVSGSTRYGLCLYDSDRQLVQELAVDRAGDLCGRKGKPCWKVKDRRGWSYKDPDAASDGVRKIKARSGAAGEGRVRVQAGNSEKKGQLAMPLGAAPALRSETSATIQVRIEGGVCVGATLSDVKKADAARFKAKTP